MAKTRQYSRKELESLRRADLQNLYKIHGLKGANQRSDLLLENLLKHFASPSFINASLPASPGNPPPPPRRLKTIEVQIPPARPVKELPRRPGPIPAVGVGVKSRSFLAAHPSRPVSRTTTTTTAAAATAVADVQGEKEWEERIRLVEEVFAERIRKLEEAYELRLREVEERWEARWAQVKLHVQTPMIPQPSPSASTPRVHLSPQKRRGRDSSPSFTPVDADADADTADLPRKRARVDDPDKTPSSAPPRTPSPSHQGVMVDNSQTPAFGIHTSFPTFATTPRPSDPKSPTIDAPPSASRPRATSAMLTPGPGRRTEPAPRAVSQAHMELTTITELEEYRAPSPSVSVSALLGPTLSRDNTPSRLSPSPSIVETRFAHPIYPSRRTPSRHMHRQSSSPAREYMDVALHGLATTESPSAQATPGHRTMLGTERYRDTRFGDIPMMQWASPNVDLGPATPYQGRGTGLSSS